MKFELTLEPSVQKNKHRLEQLKTKMKLFIPKEEIIKAFNEDETTFYLTLRQIVFIYYHPYGYDTQLTDDAMLQLYQAVVENENSNGATFYLEETEDIYPEETFLKGHSVKLDLTY